MRRPESREFLLGPTNSDRYEKRYNQLNSVMFNLLNTPVFSNLYLISSENDWQYKIHVQPFIEKLTELNIKHDFYLSTEMQNHSEISIYFPIYFKSKLMHELFDIHTEYLYLDFSKNQFSLHEKSLNLSKNQFSHNYFYNINNISHTLEPNINISPSVPGYYKFYLTVTNSSKEVVYKNLLGENYFDAGVLPEPIINMEIKDDQLICTVSTNTKLNLSFAFYIIENGRLKEKMMYQDNNFIIIDVTEGTSYTIKCFIRNGDKFKIVKNSDTIII